MPLTNSQYELIMRDYSRTRMANAAAAEAKRAEIFARCPGLSDLIREIQADSASLTRLTLDGKTEEAEKLKKKLAAKRSRRDSLLQKHGYSMDDLKPRYTCPDCRDTGFIGQEKCHCFRQAAISLLCRQSGLQSVLDRQNFSRFSLEYYSTEPMPDAGGMSYREHMEKILSECKAYARDFHRGSDSLLLIGNTGVGKTFLAGCIACEVLNSGFSVLYISAIDFFDLYRKQAIGDSDQGGDEQSELLSCDLLIIDDLGTEVITNFTTSRLFHCIDYRKQTGRPTIISTNFDPNQLWESYTERIVSRLFTSYRLYELRGEDIRYLRKAIH